MKAMVHVKKLFCLTSAVCALLTVAGCAQAKPASVPETTAESAATEIEQLNTTESKDETPTQSTVAPANEAAQGKTLQLTNGCWVMNTFQYDGFWLYRFYHGGTGTIETYNMMTGEIEYTESEHFAYRIEGEKIFLTSKDETETEFRFTPDESVLETTVDFATNGYEKNEIAVPMFRHDAPPDMDAVHKDRIKGSQYKNSAQ